MPHLRRGRVPDSTQETHPAAVFAVAGVDFQIAQGEIFCIMGLSGSGKSTLVRLINRLIEPTLGSVKVDGVEITALDALALRQQRSTHIAMVFQNVALFPHKTVVENIAYALEVRNVPRRERIKVAESLLQLVRLSDWGHRMPAQLSGGMQQRVGIARALAANPKLLLMDEPFSALDPLIRRELQDEFLDIVRRTGVTTMFITHDFDEAVYLGDHIAIMRAGRFEQLGAPREIVFSPINGYVARFISAETVIGACRADDIMRSVVPSDRLENAPRCQRSLSVPKLITLFGDGVELVQVVEDDRTIGVITRSGVTERLSDVLTRHKNATQSLEGPEGHMPLATR